MGLAVLDKYAFIEFKLELRFKWWENLERLYLFWTILWTLSSFPFRNNEWMLDQLLSTDLTFKEALDNSWGETTLRGLETLLYSLFDPWPSFSTKVGTTIM